MPPPLPFDDAGTIGDPRRPRVVGDATVTSSVNTGQ
jgi:hypothetical protein